MNTSTSPAVLGDPPHLPAIPAASTLTTPQQVAEVAAALVAWAETVDDIAQVREASAKLAAITDYVRRTSREGVAEAEAALRRLEVRVGELIGDSADSNGRPLDRDLKVMSPDARHDFRQMAANRDVVEQVIAESTDADPPSRRKVLQRITEQRPPRVQTAEERAAEDAHYRAEARRQFNLSTGNALFSLSVLADNPDKLSDFVANYEAPPSLTTDEIKAVGRAIDQMINEWRYP